MDPLRNLKKNHVLLTAHYVTCQFNILLPTICKSSLVMCHVINFNFRFAKYVLCRNKCGYPYALRCNVRQFNFCALAIIYSLPYYKRVPSNILCSLFVYTCSHLCAVVMSAILLHGALQIFLNSTSKIFYIYMYI